MPSTRKRRAGSASRETRSISQSSPRRTSLLLRRLRLLPRTQSILFLILLGTTVLLIYLRPPPNALLPELSRNPTHSLIDADLLDRNALTVQSISNLRNLRATQSGALLFDTVLTLPSSQPEPATVHIRSPRSVVLHYSESRPSLHKLAVALNLPNITSPSAIPLHLPLPPPPSLCSRSVARALARAAGFRSSSRVPVGAAVSAVVGRKTATAVRVLSKPAPEPYDWEASVPVAASCKDAPLPAKQTCRRLTQILLLTFVAGCAPIAEGELLHAPDDGQLLLGVPARCFEQGSHWHVSRDIFLAYVSKSCELPSGLFERLRALEHISWGIRDRVMALRRIVEDVSGKGEMICEQRWSFYDEWG